MKQRSILPPLPKCLRSWSLTPRRCGVIAKKGQEAEVVGRETLPPERLDTIERAEGFATDVLKADTQGSELDVLIGASDALRRSVLLAEIEVSFFPRYRGQPVFADVQAYLDDFGLELIELHRLKRYSAVNALDVANVSLGRGQRAGRLGHCDAIFLRREADLLARARADGGATLLRAIAALTAYGKRSVLLVRCAGLVVLAAAAAAAMGPFGATGMAVGVLAGSLASAVLVIAVSWWRLRPSG